MIESLNQIIETSVSFRSVGWRIEAARTGRSYGEIALLRSLLYRVEQVFLIQNDTGLLLQHVISDSVVVRDPDMISGMLTAIQNFVQDSFGAADNTLETVRVGDFTVWIQHGPQALLAGLVRGTAPIKVRELFAAALENIHQDYGAATRRFPRRRNNSRRCAACVAKVPSWPIAPRSPAFTLADLSHRSGVRHGVSAVGWHLNS